MLPRNVMPWAEGTLDAFVPSRTRNSNSTTLVNGDDLSLDSSYTTDISQECARLPQEYIALNFERVNGASHDVYIFDANYNTSIRLRKSFPGVSSLQRIGTPGVYILCVCTEHKRAMLRGGVHLRPRWDSVRCLREDAGGVGCAHVSLRRGKEHLSLLCYDTAFIQLQVPWHHLQRKGTRHHRSQSEPSIVSRSAARKRHCLTATRPRTGIRPTVWGVKCV